MVFIKSNINFFKLMTLRFAATWAVTFRPFRSSNTVLSLEEAECYSPGRSEAEAWVV